MAILMHLAALLEAPALGRPLPAAAALQDQLPSPDTWWRAWSDDPLVIAALLLAGWLYMRGVTALWRRAGVGRGVTYWHVAAFVAGWLAVVAALLSPLDALSGLLFFAHMVQHLLLLVIAPPLFLLSAPPVVLAWALPAPWRRPLAQWWHRRHRLQQAWDIASQPLLIWLVFAFTLWVWHIPALYEAALRSDFVHMLEHAAFFGTALLFWSTLSAHSRRGVRAYIVGVLFVFTTALHNTLLGVLITFAQQPWYNTYAGTTALWGLSPLEDQQLAGGIMWVPAGFVYILATLTLLYAWFRAMEQRERTLPV